MPCCALQEACCSDALPGQPEACTTATTSDVRLTTFTPAATARNADWLSHLMRAASLGAQSQPTASNAAAETAPGHPPAAAHHEALDTLRGVIGETASSGFLEHVLHKHQFNLAVRRACYACVQMALTVHC